MEMGFFLGYNRCIIKCTSYLTFIVIEMGTKHSLSCLQVDVRYHRDSFAMLKWKPELRHRSRRIEMCVYCQQQIILSCTSQNEMIQLLNRLPLMFSYMQFDMI